MIRDELLALLIEVSTALGEDLQGVVFVGGVVPSLYEGHVDVRPTEDVDCATAVTLSEYNELTARLRKNGFQHVMDAGAPVCRYRLPSGLLVDVMSADAQVLGFSNRWYTDAIEHAAVYQLPNGKSVRAVTPLYFIATKLEAFKDRGGGDYAMSHDIEDIVALLVAMPSLLEEIMAARTSVTSHLLTEFAVIVGDRDFIATVPFYFPGSSERQAKAGPFTQRLLDLRRTAQEKGLVGA